MPIVKTLHQIKLVKVLLGPNSCYWKWCYSQPCSGKTKTMHHHLEG